ncbi:hypothetical protein RND71_004876 [Anisodus tanguticus]|uniref:Uncharacterized protein n=1 Tax=Anisodus tanguticus TaxID=243964 RepID=A0AAE1VUL0_9SOLA|nr:hypothetical protein RND71_004876 [Anisodus tanguticus]
MGIDDEQILLLVGYIRAAEENKLPKEFMSKAKEKGLIVNWFPQLDVLAHRAVECFFTHCGWNLTLEALSLGVPIIGMPQWTDQSTNAKFISDVWQTGIRDIREVMEEEKGLRDGSLSLRQDCPTYSQVSTVCQLVDTVTCLENKGEESKNDSWTDDIYCRLNQRQIHCTLCYCMSMDVINLSGQQMGIVYIHDLCID